MSIKSPILGILFILLYIFIDRDVGIGRVVHVIFADDWL